MAEAEAGRLRAQALEGGEDAGASAGVEVYNTLSWPRSDLVILSPRESGAGDRVEEASGETVPSQRLSTGELAFLAANVPAMGMRAYRVVAGEAPVRRVGKGLASGPIQGPRTRRLWRLRRSPLRSTHDRDASDPWSTGLQEGNWCRGAGVGSTSSSMCPGGIRRKPWARGRPRCAGRERTLDLVDVETSAVAPGLRELLTDPRSAWWRGGPFGHHPPGREGMGPGTRKRFSFASPRHGGAAGVDRRTLGRLPPRGGSGPRRVQELLQYPALGGSRRPRVRCDRHHVGCSPDPARRNPNRCHRHRLAGPGRTLRDTALPT